MATYVAGVSTNSATGNNNNAVPVPSATVNGDLLIFGFKTNNGSAATLGAAWTSLDSATNTIWSGFAQRVASSEPASYSPTWTGSTETDGIIICIKNTDGTTPTVDVHTITTAGASPAQVTTTANDELILVVVTDNTGGTITARSQPLSLQTNLANGAKLLYGGQDVKGTTTWLPTNMTFGGAGQVITETIGINCNTTYTSNFVGVGSDNVTPGTSMTISSPSNAGAGDTLLAGIVEGSSKTGIAITPPPIIALRGTPTTNLNVSTSSLTISVPTTVTGDLMIAHILAVGTPTPPAGWTLFLHDTSSADDLYYSRTSTGASEPANYTWTIAGANLFDGSISDFFDSSGGTLAVGNSLFLAGGAATSFTSARVTTTHNNACIYNEWEQSTTTTITLPGTQNNSGLANGTGYAIGWFNQATAGLTPTQTATSGTSSAWRSCQVEIYSTTAAAQSTNTMWTSVGSAVDPTGAVQLSVYWMYAATQSAAGPSLFIFASAPTSSDGIMCAFANLEPSNAVDFSQFLSNAAFDNPAASSITPTPFDELVCYLATPGVGFGTTTIFTAGGSNNRIGVSYGSLYNIGTRQSGGSNTNPFVTATLGLRTKAH